MEHGIGRFQKNRPQAAAGLSLAWVPTASCLLPKSLKSVLAVEKVAPYARQLHQVDQFHPFDSPWAGGKSWPETASAFFVTFQTLHPISPELLTSTGWPHCQGDFFGDKLAHHSWLIL